MTKDSYTHFHWISKWLLTISKVYILPNFDLIKLVIFSVTDKSIFTAHLPLYFVPHRFGRVYLLYPHSKQRTCSYVHITHYMSWWHCAQQLLFMWKTFIFSVLTCICFAVITIGMFSLFFCFYYSEWRLHFRMCISQQMFRYIILCKVQRSSFSVKVPYM